MTCDLQTDVELPGAPPDSVQRLVSTSGSLCSVCGRITTNFPAWDKRKWACRPCWNGYVAFRRAFKAEHGRYPTIKHFRE